MNKEIFEQMLIDAAAWQPQQLLGVLDSPSMKEFQKANRFRFWAQQNHFQQFVEVGVYRNGEMYSSTLMTWRKGEVLPTEQEIKGVVLAHLATLPSLIPKPVLRKKG